jgi:CBS domain containing-hemolysin-like protein
VVGGAYFAATESSFSAVNKIKVKTLADDGNRRAKGVMYVLNKFDKALTTLLVGNNVTKIAGASVFTLIATKVATETYQKDENFINSFAFSILCSAISTAIIFLFSEMIPKSFANDRAQSVSLFFQGSLRLLMKILAPFAAFFGLISNGASRLFASKEPEPSITEDELSEIIETAEEEGVVDEEQGDMLKSALEFGETTVGDIMTMAKDIDALNIAANTGEVLEVIRNTNFSRIPVYSGTPGRIIGTLRVRNFLTEYRTNPKVKVRSLLVAPYFVRDNVKIDGLLTDMRQHKRHMAIVQDAKRQVVGLVTIEDILEELVGEIFDEEDEVDQNFQALGGNKYMINTHMLMGEAYERMGLAKASRTIAPKPILSFMLEMLGHLPAEDESFLYGDLEFTSKTVENGRVTEVIVHILDEEDLAERAAAANAEDVEA